MKIHGGNNNCQHAKVQNELHVSDAFKIADMIVIDVWQLVRLEGK